MQNTQATYFINLDNSPCAVVHAVLSPLNNKCLHVLFALCSPAHDVYGAELSFPLSQQQVLHV